MFDTAHERFLLFASGVALVASAGIIFFAARRNPAPAGLVVAALFALAQGLADWSGALALYLNEPLACRLLRLSLLAVALLALIQFGQRAAIERRPWLLRHWQAAPLLVLAIVGALFGAGGYVEIACRVLIAYQAGALALEFFLHHAAEANVPGALTVAVVALLVYLMTTCLPIPALSAVAALATVAALWLADRKAQSPAERGGLLRQSSWPVAVGVLLVAGWFVLGHDAGTTLELVGVDSIAATELISADVAPAASSSLTALLWKVGLPVLLLALFVVGLRALSRLPNVC